jgi:hypothetical protein
MTKSFTADIWPLFHDRDINCMRPSPHGVLLADFAYMSNPGGDSIYSDHANARHVHARLTGSERPRMPMGGPYWSAPDIDTYEQWMSDGFLP